MKTPQGFLYQLLFYQNHRSLSNLFSWYHHLLFKTAPEVLILKSFLCSSEISKSFIPIVPLKQKMLLNFNFFRYNIIYILNRIGSIMKSSKSEYLYLFLSLIALAATIGLYLFFGRNYGHYDTKNSSGKQPMIVKQEKKETPEEKQLAEFQTSLTELEKTPSSQTLASLQESLANITDEAKKTEFQNRLNTVSTELTHIAAAETAVANAEGYQVPYNVDVAQTAINLITNEGKKAELQARIDVVAKAIPGYSVETTSVSTGQ